MNINTKYFGSISYTQEELLHFSDGLFGFEDLTEFLPLAFQDNEDVLISLQSITNENIAFILMNPFLFMEDYMPDPELSDIQAIGSPVAADISYYVICVLKDDIKQSTVNLKCPIMVNAVTRDARQVILSDSKYELRHLLIDLTKKEV